MNWAEKLAKQGIRIGVLNEGVLQPVDKSKLSQGTKNMIQAAKQPFDFVADVLGNEILVSIEGLLGVKDIKGLSDTMKEKAKEIAVSYLDTVQYPKEGGSSEPAPAGEPAAAPEEPAPDTGKAPEGGEPSEPPTEGGAQ